MGYVYIRGIRLLILKKSPGGTIIPGGTFIRKSRVAHDQLDGMKNVDFF